MQELEFRQFSEMEKSSNNTVEGTRAKAARAPHRERWAANDSSESNTEVKMGTLLALLRHQILLIG
jgi:hypothetical protein